MQILFWEMIGIRANSYYNFPFDLMTKTILGALPENFLDEHAPSLMQIAEKYALEPLKLLCQEKLISR